MPTIARGFKKNAINIALIAVLVLLALYLFSEEFRCFLSDAGIDPNFIIGFFTVVALLLSLRQSSIDKRYAYNLRLIQSLEEKGLRIIGKLLGIKQKSASLLATMEAIKTCMDKRIIFVDQHNVTDKSDIDADMELVTTYVHTHFNELGSNWNEVIEKVREVGNYAGNVILNYNKNVELIEKRLAFENEALDNFPSSLIEARRLNDEIDKLTASMTDDIVQKINDTTKQVKDSIDARN